MNPQFVDRIISAGLSKNSKHKILTSYIQSDNSLIKKAESLEELKESLKKINEKVQFNTPHNNESATKAFLNQISEQLKKLSSIFLYSSDDNKDVFSNYLQFLIDNKNIIEFDKELKSYDVESYSIVVNYSIYGLNSEVTGDWLDALFAKNDGYQTPIVMNPFRAKGIIDINKEYLLAQARMILYKIVMKQSYLIKGLKIDKINFLFDYTKHQYLSKKYNNEQDLTSKKMFEFANILYGKYEESRPIAREINKANLNQLIKSLFEIVTNTNDDLHAQLTESFKKIYGEGMKYGGEITGGQFWNEKKLNTEPFKINCMLYIFKKIIKITEKYNEYKKYNFLFDGSDTLFVDRKFEEVVNLGKAFGEVRSFIEEKKIENIYDFNLNVEEIIDIILKYVRFSDLAININVNNKKDLFKEFLQKGFDDILRYFESNKLFSLTNSIAFINYVYHSLNKDFRNQNINQYIRLKLFKQLIIQLKEDESHITFKLKQALMYFEKDIFNYITAQWENQLDENNKLPIDLEQSYLRAKKTQKTDPIYDAPLAFFEPNIVILKKKDDSTSKSYSFKTLSSGEQQYIHSILSVVYHIYNINSVQKRENKKVYRKINLIFDELELYFHPEYQRIYINNLVNILKAVFPNDAKSSEALQFNILLSTHSPFILSDIPTQNVLKLKEGVPIPDKNGKNSFGANIHDLLADEFFLENGFMGEFAKQKISELYDRLTNTHINESNYKVFLTEIKLIGEPVLRIPLLEFLDKKLQESISDNEKLVTYYQEIINKLNNHP